MTDALSEAADRAAAISARMTVFEAALGPTLAEYGAHPAFADVCLQITDEIRELKEFLDAALEAGSERHG
jgi:hypothetical protein